MSALRKEREEQNRNSAVEEVDSLPAVAANWSHLPPPDQYVSPEEYFRILEDSEERLEWLDGVIYPVHDPFRSLPQAMAGASDKHIDIQVEMLLTLGNALRDSPCRVVTPDQKVKCGDSYVFPDITVYCGEREKDENGWLTNAVVVIEILSPRTSRYDQGLKWEKYRQMAKLQDFLFVSQDKLLVEHRRRQKKNRNRWELIYYNRLEDEIALDSIGARISLHEIYARLAFQGEAESAE
jgi:Uma2 family endonuclease